MADDSLVIEDDYVDEDSIRAAFDYFDADKVSVILRVYYRSTSCAN